MHASTITSSLLISLLSLGALASPITDTTQLNTFTRRTNSCTANLYVNKEWDIYVDNDTGYNDACGSGCLDNIRGRCGVVTGWGCSRDAAGTGHYMFSTVPGCTEWDMTQALKVCTKGEQTIDCNRITGA